MEELVVTEGVVPVAKCCLIKLWQELRYVFSYESNIGDLKEQVQQLSHKRDGKKLDEKTDSDASKIIDGQVTDWLVKANNQIEKTEKTFNEKSVAAKAACCNGWLPNWIGRFCLGRRAKKMTLEVEKLFATEPNIISHPGPPPEVEFQPTEEDSVQLGAKFHEGASSSGTSNHQMEMTLGVDELRAKDLGIIAHPAPHPDVKFQPTDKSTQLGINFHEGASSSETSNQEQPTALLNFDSRRSTIREVMEALRGNQINPIIICGMGGIGKTTLMGQVHKKAKADALFDEYTKATVKESLDLNLIQDQLARYLGLPLEGNETEARASRLRARLSQGSKKVLVMLDNVSTTTENFLWDIGIPHGCKLLVTSRQQDLFKKMNARKNFIIEALSDEDAWRLFKETAGSSIESDPRLHDVTKKVLKKCAGLPIAISTVGTAQKDASIAIWKNALRELEKANPENIPGVIEHVYGKIKLSYERLPNEQARSCLLLCCLFKEGSDIRIEDLVAYGLGLGIFKEIDSIDKGRNLVETLVHTLKSRFLLLDCDYNDPAWVKMHDVVRDVAVHIAFEKSNVVRAAVHIAFEKSTVVRDTVETLKSIGWPMSDRFRSCRSLVTGGRCVLLQLEYSLGGGTEKAPTSIDAAEDLKVLDIAGPYFNMLSVASTVQSIAVLRNLKTLRLERCFIGPDVSLIGELRALIILSFRRSDIGELPDTFRNLSNLRSLNLTECRLRIIAPGVISSLTRLEELYMWDSFEDWVVEKLASTETTNWISQLEEEEAVEKWKSLNKLAVEQPANVGELFRKEVGRYLREYTRWANSMDWKTGILAELLSLSRLTTLEVGLPPLNVLETTTVFDKLERFKISIGWKEHAEEWDIRGNDNYLTVGDLDKSAAVNLLLLNKTTRLEFQRESVKYLIDPTTIPHSNIAIFPFLRSLDISRAEMLKEIFPGEVLLPTGSFKELRSLELTYLDALPYIWKKTKDGSEWSVLRDILGLLQKLVIKHCKSLEEIVAIEFENEEVINFQSLTHLALDRLPNFTGIIKNISKGPERVPEDSIPKQSDVNPDEFLPQFLFNTEVCFPALRELDIGYMKFKEIWNNQLPAKSFCELESLKVESCSYILHVVPTHMQNRLHKLKSMKVRSCSSLKEIFEIRRLVVGDDGEAADLTNSESGNQGSTQINKMVSFKQSHQTFQNLTAISIYWCESLSGTLFSPSIARGLVKLQKLEIEYCEKIEEIVAAAVEGDEETEDENMLPQLRTLTLDYLPNLGSFSQGKYNFMWPLLGSVKILQCPNMKKFCLGSLSIPKGVTLPFTGAQ